MGTLEYKGAVIVVPTRNRSDIAKSAIRLALNQPGCEVRVMVSDNSTDPHELEDLDRYCAQLGDDRLRYVKPPAPLSMTAHWEWAIEQALESYDANHFLYLTDRMMFKPNALQEVLGRAAAYPRRIISYNHDRIVDDRRPIRIEQYLYTGKLLEVKTLRLSYLYSRALFAHGFPRMLNCIVPREVLERIKQRFGNVFTSIAPDFLFCCRCLEMEESVLYFDKSPIFHYALDRSHGASLTRGEMTPANVDFRANLKVDASTRNYGTPIPQLITATNAIFHEYLIFKQETNSSRFFDIDLQEYLQANGREIHEVIDPRLKSKMLELIKAHGFKMTNDSRPSRSFSTIMRKLISPSALWNRLSKILKASASGPKTKRFWLFLNRCFGIRPPDDNGFEFDELSEAIEFIKRFPRRPVKDLPWQENLLQAHEVPFPSIETK